MTQRDQSQFDSVDLEDLYKTAPVGLCLVDRELRYVRINEELAAINGYPIEEHMGKTVRDIVPAIADVVEKEYKRVFETGIANVSFFVAGITHQSPAQRTWQVGYYPIRGEDGRVEYVNTVVVEITELKAIEEELRESQQKLLEQSRTLERKNAALKELLEQIEFEKQQIREDILSNVYELVFPAIKELQQRIAPDDRVYVELLQRNLEELASHFGKRISDTRWSLSPREKEICNMIREGLSTKEIAAALRTSASTVDNHRMNIRKKLGIANKSVNLTTFLQSL